MHYLAPVPQNVREEHMNVGEGGGVFLTLPGFLSPFALIIFLILEHCTEDKGSKNDSDQTLAVKSVCLGLS